MRGSTRLWETRVRDHAEANNTYASKGVNVQLWIAQDSHER